MPRFRNRPFLSHGPLLFVIPSVPGFPTSPLSPATTYVVLPKENHMQLTEAATLDRKSGGAERICGAPFVGPAPTGLQPSHPRNLPGNIHLPFVIPGFQEYSVEPQIRSAALGMTKRRGPWERKGRLLDERAVAEPRNCLNPIWAADDLHPTRIYSAKRASKQSTSYILKKPVAPLIWTALVELSPCNQDAVLGRDSRGEKSRRDDWNLTGYLEILRRFFSPVHQPSKIIRPV